MADSIDNTVDMQECPICGVEVVAEAEFRAYKGFVGFFVPGRSGILHRHNLANWSTAREDHITPTAARAIKQAAANGKKGSQLAKGEDIENILAEIGETGSQ